MSVIRRGNWLGQQRVDVAHLRAMESAVSGDFDALAGRIIAGSKSFIIKGFEINILGIGGQASALQMSTASGSMLHPLASESGTIFFVPDDRAIEVLSSTNPRVQGSFTANQTNFIGIDLRRTADDSTSDLVQFLDPLTKQEVPEEVPLARTLDYKIVISTTDFASTPAITAVAKVVTDASNNVVSITDSRNLMYRLGSGGSIPNNQHAFPWVAGREEYTTGSIFAGGDKTISSQKDWQDAIMTRLWELGGGKYWYSPTADRNVQLMRTGGAPFGNSDWFELVGAHLHWSQLTIVFDNSGGTVRFNDIQNQTTDVVGLTDILDGECIYVDIDRFNNRTGVTALAAKKASLATLGAPLVPGSRFVIAYRNGATIFSRGATFPIGFSFTPASTLAAGIVKLTHSALNPADPKVYSDGAADVANGVVTLDASKNASITSITGTPLTLVSGGAGGDGIFAVGNGTGRGGRFIGGATNAAGVRGEGTGTGAGANLEGGSTGGNGVTAIGGFTSGSGRGGLFTGGNPNGVGVQANGVGTGQGVLGFGGSSGGTGVQGGVGGGNGIGVLGTGGGTGTGVSGTGGGTSGPGGLFTGGAPNGSGLNVFGTGSGTGTISFGGTTSGTGGQFTGGAPNGIGLVAQGTGTGIGANIVRGPSSNTAIQSVGDIQIVGGTAFASAAILTSNNVVRGYAKFTIEGTLAPVVHQSWNVGVNAPGGGSDFFTIDVGGCGFVDTNWICVATGTRVIDGSSFTLIHAQPDSFTRSPTFCVMRLYTSAGAVISYPAFGPWPRYTVDIMVIGR